MKNKYNLPKSIVNALEKDVYDGPKNDLSTISVTTLIQPPKIRMLKHRHADEIEEDVSDNIWRLLGSSVHAMLEHAGDASSLIEERLTMKFGEKTLSGKTDVYDAEECCIQDFKVTSAWSVTFSPEGKKEWTEQLNCLALLYRNAGFEVKSLKIVAILRDWSDYSSKKEGGYPKSPIVVIDVPLWTKDAQEFFVHNKIHEHAYFESIPDDQIPECTPQDRWQTETKYAIMKNDNKRADKVFDTFVEAQFYLEHSCDKKHRWRIDERPGSDKRCEQYCQVAQFCHYGQRVFAWLGQKVEMAV